MKVAISTWSGRVSPVFDVAKALLIVDLNGDAEVSRAEVAIEETGLPARARHVAQLGVNVLICGAISAPLETMLIAAGVRVIPHTCGPAEEVLRAFALGQLTEQAFLMPGCCGRRRRFRGRHSKGRHRFDAQGDRA
jgi:predicted Fe-Mo cluster-binding NifX family protein